jgi:cellobiose phosphorylase
MTTWNFIDGQGTFELHAPHRTSALYFPLVNEAGMMSAVSPLLNGDAKTGQNTFVTLPVSVEDLHNTRSARNFWVVVDGTAPWSATGNSALQVAQTFDADAGDTVTLQAGLLWHQVTRENRRLGLRAEITSVVPAGDDPVELMQVTLTNTGDRPLALTPTAAIPLYGRSADNLRDHRHVTSLLHRIRTERHGVLVCPTLTFDERGHQPNTLTYTLLGAEAGGAAPLGFFPVLEDFIGEGGSLEWPEAIVKPGQAALPSGVSVAGYEAMGALRFRELHLAPGQSHAYVLVLGVVDSADDAAAADDLVARYGSATGFAAALETTRESWQARTQALAFCTVDPRFDQWTRWVAIQPTLRRLMGNSFLPYHDYGRGGRGWRDLWQDILALLLASNEDVGDLLLSYFAGVRIDGSNATIIGRQPGEFKADRNNIPRVWMDHGAWPFLTVKLYIDQSGDLAFLLREQDYFRDHATHRCQQVDPDWQAGQDTVLHSAAGEPYRGSVLEHMLVQHLTAFFNVGEAGNTILLEGADWNDGLDMARQRGESVAFTALYAGNLQQLADLALAL